MAYLPLDMDYLTDEMNRRAKAELKECPETRKRALEEIKRLIKENKSLRYPLDDDMLLPFLRVKKFNVERAFSLLKRIVHYKENYEDTLGDKNFELIKRICHDKTLSVLPYRDDKDGAVFFVIQARYIHLEEISPEEYIYAAKTISKWVTFLYPATQVCGGKVIVDIEGLGLKHLRYLTPRILYIIAENLRNGIVFRLRQYHVINNNSVFQILWNIAKHTLTMKIRSRVNFHAHNLESLHGKVNPDLLPKYLGGKLPDESTTYWFKILDIMENLHYRLKEASGILPNTQ